MGVGATSLKRPAERMLARAAYGLAMTALLSGAVNALVLVSPLYMLQVYDRVLRSYSVETLVYLSMMAAACVAALGIFDWLRGVALARLGRWWDETARPDVLAAALASARRDGPAPGSSLQDLQQVRAFVGSPSMLPFFDAPWTPLFLALIFLLHPLLGLIAVLSALVLACFAIGNDVATRLSLAGCGARQADNATFAATALRNADVVHAMGMQPSVIGLHGKRQEAINRMQQKAGERSAMLLGASKAIRLGVQTAILGAGAYLVIENQLTPGGMIAASIILGRALAPVEQAIGAWRSFVAAREAHGRVKALLRRTPPETEPTALPAPAGRLSVENVSFYLQGQERPVLRQVGLQVAPGMAVAVVGPSAAGKSTLCRLLVGSWLPSGGQVRLDGAALGQWRSADRARFVGYLPQAVELFGGTVRDNIARLGDAVDAEVAAAARLAGCHEMILRLPKGYDTEIGDGGTFLSGGQRQRIALARALFGDPRLVVLDEPNSNLDQEGEAALVAAISAAKEKGAALVVVSHSFAMMRVVDAIMVLRDGAVEKFGPRDQILRELQPVPLRAQTAPGEFRREAAE